MRLVNSFSAKSSLPVADFDRDVGRVFAAAFGDREEQLQQLLPAIPA